MMPMPRRGNSNLDRGCLVLLPMSTSKLVTQWQGLFEIIHRVGQVDYEVHRPGQQWEKQIYHVNLLWEWHEPKGWATFTEANTEDLGPQGVAWEEIKTRMGDQVQIVEELSASQKCKMQALVWEFKDVFREEPGWVRDTYHSIKTPSGAIV